MIYSRGTGWAARRDPVTVLYGYGPFPRSRPPNRAGTFRCTRLSSDYAACVTGVAWTWSWQSVQTMSVLRRIRPMRAAHAGWPGPGVPRSASLATWWTVTVVPCSHSSHRPARSRWISSLRGAGAGTGAGSRMTARLSRLSCISPNRATRSGLPSRFFPASKQVRGPSGVVTAALWRAAIAVTVDWYVRGHLQPDCPVDRASASGDPRAGVLDGDVIAEEPRPLGAGMGDQGLGGVEFQEEGLSQEPCQLCLDLLGLGPGPPVSAGLDPRVRLSGGRRTACRGCGPDGGKSGQRHVGVRADLW